jgi:hypothetical protein
MSRYNQKGIKPKVSHVMESSPKASFTTKTYGGADGYAREAKSELFIRATSSFAGQGSFYENADKRDDRLVELTHQLAVTPDGWAWLSGFLPWLRSEGNMRTAPILIASEAVKARLDAKIPSPVALGLPGVTRTASGGQGKTPTAPAMTHRQLLDSVMQRADEPGEMLAYWLATYGRKLPQPVKRAIADAAKRLYNERSFLKYDSEARGIRLADVLELTHPSPAADKPWQGDLFKYMIDKRHNRPDILIPDSLQVLQANKTLTGLPVKDRRAYVLEPDLVTSPGGLSGAGFTWERLAGWLQGPMDAAAWEAIIPSMGYMAVIRNLRNFDEAGVNNTVAKKLAEKISDPNEVAKSRQLPFRFLSAYENAPSLRWGQALEEALDLSLKNIPELPGRTLVLIDTSGSMDRVLSNKGTVTAVRAAALFGLAFKLKNPDTTDVCGWADGQFSVEPDKGASLLRLSEEFAKMVGSVGHGTQMANAVKATFKSHDRILILSDMQAFPDSEYARYSMYGIGDVNAAAPSDVPIYCWNIVGYGNSAMPSGGKSNRYDLAGLTDSAFRMIGQLEAAQNSQWPWEK